MITQKAIAEKLNISQKTVSRVINGSEDVKPETREKVLRLVRESNYRLNINARNLCIRRTGNIGVLLSGANAFSSFYFLQSFRGINEYVGERDYKLFFTVLDDRQRINEVYEQCDGFIIFDISGIGQFVPEMTRILKSMKKEMVFIQSDNRGRLPYVTIDNERGGYDATCYLIELGHRQIAFFGYGEGSHECLGRINGYRNALRDHGIRFNEGDLFYHSKAGFMATFMRFLEVLEKERPTAVFCWSDHDARVLIYECLLRGIMIPADLSIVGFDDRPDYAMMANPYLTTMRQPFYELGQVAAEMLFNLIDGKKKTQKKRLIKPELIERESCKAVS